MPFIDGVYGNAINYIRDGGLMVVPAAPGLATINTDKKYYNALINSDFALPDSGFMLLVIKIFKHVKIKKLSGLAFLDKFFNENELKNEKCLFLVEPSEESAVVNNQYLKSKSILIDHDDHYVAPFFNRKYVVDHDLLNIIEKKQPKYIIINLSGGIQERLGIFLRDNLSYKPGIICTGAAIAFLTGRQAKIPNIIDKLYLGWLWRCICNPKDFIPRYLSGFKLFFMLINEPITKMD